MTTSTPPAWKWLDECYVPETMDELSVDLRNLPVADTLHEQNDSGTEPEMSSFTTKKLEPDPTGEDAWPLERAVSTTASGTCCTDQCPDCRCAPNTPHATGCGWAWAAHLTNAVISAAPEHVGSCVSGGSCGHRIGMNTSSAARARIGTCYLDPDTGETVMPADFFGEKELRWTGKARDNLHYGEPLVKVAAPETTSPAHSSHETASFPQGENSADVKVETCPECAALHAFRRDGLIPGETAAVEETFDVPFPVQSWLFEALIELEVDHLHEIIDDHRDEIVKMARRRHRTGHVLHGSKGYGWDAKTRLRNVLEELADAPTYLTMGSIE